MTATGPIRRNRPLAAATAAAVCLLARAGAAHDPPRATVTWNRDIAPLVHARCVRCHSPDGPGPMSLVTYKEARPWARAMREEVLARRMPKWHAAHGYGQFANDRSLSPFEIALVVAWVDGGAVKGADPVTPEPRSPIPDPATAAMPGRDVRVACNDPSLPAGRLLAITPRLGEGQSAGFSVRLPDRRTVILAWIRNFERAFEETYWLQRPLDLPAGSRLAVTATRRCSITLRIE